MASVLRQLEAILEVNRRVLAAPDDDIEQLQEWGARRELMFARMQAEDFSLLADERAAAVSLMKEITGSDAAILCRLQQNLMTLSQKKTAAVKMQEALGSSARFHPAVLLQRLV
jgi:hypothetical protein